jgi:O-antigen/teichoic acid export membrane protein
MTMLEDRAVGPVEAPGQDAGSIVARTARSGIWSMAGSLAGGVSAFVVSVIVARSLAPATFGSYAYLMWAMRLVGTLLAFGIPMAVARFVSASLGSGAPARARGTVRAAFRANLVLAPAAFGIVAALATLKTHEALIAGSLAGASALLVLNGTFDGVLVGHRRFDRLAKALFFGALAQLALIALGAWFGVSWRGFVFLQVAAVGTGVLLVGRASRRLTAGVRPAPIGPQGRRRFVSFATIMGLQTAVDLVLWGRAEIFFLERWRSSAEVGLYTVALSLAALSAALPVLGGRVFFPEFSWLRGGGHDDAMRKAFPMICTYLAAIAVPLSIVGAALAGWLIRILYGPAFVSGSATAAVLMAGSLLGTIGAPSTAATFAGPRPSIVLRIVVVLAAVNVGLDWVLIPRFGMIGGAAASVSSQGVAVAVVIGYARRRLGLRYPILAVSKLVVAGAAAGVAAWLVASSMPGIGGLGAAILAGTAVYLCGVRVAGVIRWAEIRQVLRRRAALAGEAVR